jgi:predicted fused transcriptional regulator/phosphomethylpyrimidine kinase
MDKIHFGMARYLAETDGEFKVSNKQSAAIRKKYAEKTANSLKSKGLPSCEFDPD